MNRGFAPKTALLATALITFFALGAGQALGSHVACGNTITQDTTLDSDLIDCPDDGINIGADNITLDLNGHVLDGTFDELEDDPLASEGFTGVNNRLEHDGVTIKNGRIQEFWSGVSLGGRLSNSPGTLQNVLRGLTVFHANRGVNAFDADYTLIEGNSFRTDRSGVSMVQDSDWNVIVGNLSDAMRPLTVTGGGGIGIAFDSDHNVVERNEVRRGPIIFLFADDNIAKKNSVGFYLDAGIGIRGDRNVVEKNEVFGNSAGVIVNGGVDSRIEKNVLSDNRGDGVRLVGVGGLTTVEHNVATGNRDDGIDIDSRGVVIAHTRADGNGDFGIEAVAGTIDGGGNRASGNGNPLQCLNVRCK